MSDHPLDNMTEPELRELFERVARAVKAELEMIARWEAGDWVPRAGTAAEREAPRAVEDRWAGHDRLCGLRRDWPCDCGYSPRSG